MFYFYDVAIGIAWILEGGLTAFCLYYTLNRKYSMKITMAVSLLIISAVTVIVYALGLNLVFRQLLFSSSLLVICRCLYRSSWKADLFSILILFVMTFVCDLIVAVLMRLFFPSMDGYPDGSHILTANLPFLMLFLTSVFAFLLLWKRKRDRILKKSVYATLLFPLSQFFLLEAVGYYIIIQITQGADDLAPMLCIMAGCVLCVLADIALFQVILLNSQKERLAAQLEMMEAQAYRELEYYHSIDEKIQEIRKIRHDFNNQLQTAYCMIAKGQAKGRKTALQLLEQLERQIERSAPPVFCPNLIVNVILEEKSRLAEKQGITMKISVSLPERLNMEKADLCSIFSNLLDNAVHAAALAPAAKIVVVRAWLKAGYCMVKVKNTYGTADVPDREKNTEHQGIGLFILRSVAEKYDGELTIEKTDSVFEAVVRLRLPG